MLDTIVYMVYYYSMSNTHQTKEGTMKQVSTANGNETTPNTEPEEVARYEDGGYANEEEI
jgi:hypothetical protein